MWQYGPALNAREVKAQKRCHTAYSPAVSECGSSFGEYPAINLDLGKRNESPTAGAKRFGRVVKIEFARSKLMLRLLTERYDHFRPSDSVVVGLQISWRPFEGLEPRGQEGP